MSRRRILAFLVSGGITGLAGCAAFGDDWVTEATNEPEYDDTVTTVNRSNESVDVTLTITHDGPERVVHHERYTVAAESELETYDFRNAPTDGVEVFVIEGSFPDGEVVSFRFPTHACTRDPGISIDVDGTPRRVVSDC